MSNRRRVRGEGSISKRADGRYMGRYRVTQPDGVRKTLAVYARTKDECAKKLRDALTKADTGLVSISNTMTVEAYYQFWRSSIAPNYLKPTTLQLYDQLYKSTIIPFMGKKRLSSLNPTDVQKMVSHILRSGGSVRKTIICRNALSTALERARKQRLIIVNPARGIELPRYKPTEKDIWTLEQVKTFLDCAQKTSSYYAQYKLLSFLALRRGEVLGIRAEDVIIGDGSNGDWGVLQIRQQVVEVNHVPTIQTPKTESSVRDLPLIKEIAELLAPLVEQTVSGLLFHTKSGKPLSPNNFNRDFRKVVKRANLPKITLHALRHCGCTFLRDAGVDPKTAQVIMGHADPSITLRIYQHSGIEDKRRGLDKLANLYAMTTA